MQLTWFIDFVASKSYPLERLGSTDYRALTFKDVMKFSYISTSTYRYINGATFKVGRHQQALMSILALSKVREWKYFENFGKPKLHCII